MSVINLTVQIDDYQKEVLVAIEDEIGIDVPDEYIFYYYETFEEIFRNDAVDFDVLEIDGTDINEFI